MFLMQMRSRFGREGGRGGGGERGGERDASRVLRPTHFESKDSGDPVLHVAFALSAKVSGRQKREEG